MNEGKFDPHRRLCPDGACVGVIGDDGRCRVCGRSAGGKEAAPVGFVPVGDGDLSGDQDDNLGDDLDDVAEAEAGPEAKNAAGGAGFDPTRRLCPDGSCVGVVGADGICNVCGQKAD
jgi:hypothetical protein